MFALLHLGLSIGTRRGELHSTLSRNNRFTETYPGSWVYSGCLPVSVSFELSFPRFYSYHLYRGKIVSLCRACLYCYGYHDSSSMSMQYYSIRRCLETLTFPYLTRSILIDTQFAYFKLEMQHNVSVRHRANRLSCHEITPCSSIVVALL